MVGGERWARAGTRRVRTSKRLPLPAVMAMTAPKPLGMATSVPLTSEAALPRDVICSELSWYGQLT